MAAKKLNKANREAIKLYLAGKLPWSKLSPNERAHVKEHDRGVIQPPSRKLVTTNVVGRSYCVTIEHSTPMTDGTIRAIRSVIRLTQQPTLNQMKLRALCQEAFNSLPTGTKTSITVGAE